MTDVTKVPEQDLATGFRDVDRTGDPGYYVRFLEGVSGVEWIRQMKRRTYELMQSSQLPEPDSDLRELLRHATTELSRHLAGSGWIPANWISCVAGRQTATDAIKAAPARLLGWRCGH